MYVELMEHVDAVADVFDNFDLGVEVLSAFSCQEVETIAGLFAAVGRNDTAQAVVAWHSLGDEEDDEHFELGERERALRLRRPGLGDVDPEIPS
jgi:hypothetical protein